MDQTTTPGEDRPSGLMKKDNILSPGDTAQYLYNLIASIQKVAANQQLPLLAHLLGLARMEAKRNLDLTPG
jgi:hypothetical protein